MTNELPPTPTPVPIPDNAIRVGVLLDTGSVVEAAALPFVDRDDRPHTWEHSLEVHLPFLQIALGDFLDLRRQTELLLPERDSNAVSLEPEVARL